MLDSEQNQQHSTLSQAFSIESLTSQIDIIINAEGLLGPSLLGFGAWLPVFGQDAFLFVFKILMSLCRNFWARFGVRNFKTAPICQKNLATASPLHQRESQTTLNEQN